MRPKVKEGVRKRWEIGNWKNYSIALSSGGGGFKENVCLPSVNGYIHIDISIYLDPELLDSRTAGQYTSIV